MKKHNSISLLKKLLIILVVLMGYMLYSLPPSDTKKVEIPTGLGLCSEEVKSELSKKFKSPSTVEFVSCSWSTRLEHTKEEGITLIGGEADSQNGFGAIVRTKFKCEVGNGKEDCQFE